MFARHHELPLALIAFRGTEADSQADLAADLDVAQTAFAPGYDPDFGQFNDGGAEWGTAHRGFFDAFRTIAHSDVAYEVLHNDDEGFDLWVSGHSLGGAVATLYTAMLLDRLEKSDSYGDRIRLRGRTPSARRG